MTQRFFCRREDMWRDQWTYGNWTQFICNRSGPKGPTQCARPSGLPFYSFLFGVLLLALVAMAIYVGIQKPTAVRWENVVGLLFAGLIFAGWPLYLRFSGWRLMTAVGPLNDGATRVLPGDPPKPSDVVPPL